MAITEKLKAQVDKMPAPDGRGLLSSIDEKTVDAALAAITALGRAGVVGLVEMLVEPQQGADVKARYALHALATQAGARPEAERRAFATALASTLGGDRPKSVTGFVVRQLQVAGGEEVAASLGKLLLDDDLCEYATQALLAIGKGAAAQFRTALGSTKGGTRLTVVQALGVSRDASSAAAVGKVAADKDRDTRLVALWSLANIGDPASVDLLIRASDVKPTHERTKATQACLLLAERLLAAGRKKEPTRIYRHLRDTRTDASERYVRDIAGQALNKIG